MGGSVRIASMVHDDGLGRDRLVFLREADMRLLYAHRHYKVGEIAARATTSSRAWARRGSTTAGAGPMTGSR